MLALLRSGLLLPGCVFRVITSTRAGGLQGGRGSGCRPEGHPANPDRAAAAPGAAPALSRRQLEHNFPGTPALLSAPGFKPREVEPLAAPIPPLPDTPPPARASARPCRPVPVPEVFSGFAVPGSSESPRDPYLGHGELHRARCRGRGLHHAPVLCGAASPRFPAAISPLQARLRQGRSEPSPVRCCPAQGRMCFFKT